MIKKLLVIEIVAAALLIGGCAYLQSPQGAAAIASAETIASTAISAAATTYGGPAAGQYASAGLSALGAVLQGYVGYVAPQNVVVASPGVAGVGTAVAKLVPASKPITQSDVNTVQQAAAIAAHSPSP